MFYLKVGKTVTPPQNGNRSGHWFVRINEFGLLINSVNKKLLPDFYFNSLLTGTTPLPRLTFRNNCQTKQYHT